MPTGIDRRAKSPAEEPSRQEAEIAALRGNIRALERRLASYESKSPSAILKRLLHLLLDAIEISTPEKVRASVRRQYLHHVYFTLFPEKRPNANAAAPKTHEAESIHPYCPVPFLDLKRRLYGNLPLDFEGLSVPCHRGRVSVVLPVYNGARFLEQSIESVLCQTYSDLELIVVDDGSTDETPRILERCSGDPRVKVIRQSNQRLPAALNTGFRAATGEFYTWTSDDNIMLPEQLSELVRFLRRHPDSEFVYADEELIDERGRPALDSDFCPGYQVPEASNRIHWPRHPGNLNFVQDNYIGACFLYRAWAARIVGDYDERCFGFEDYDYWMRFNALFRISHLGSAAPLYQYRLHDGSLTAREKELQITARARDFMCIERERRDFFTDPFDVTFLGDYPWFAELAAHYRQAGNNVLELKRLDDLAEYRYEITRAFRKAVLIVSSDAGAEGLRRLQQKSKFAPVAVLIDKAASASGFDWIIQDSKPRDPDLSARNVLIARHADNVAYPILAIANRLLAP